MRDVSKRDASGAIVRVERLDDDGTLLAVRTAQRDSRGNLTRFTETLTAAGEAAKQREERRAAKRETEGAIGKLRKEFAALVDKAVAAARREGRAEGKKAGYSEGYADGEASQKRRDRAMFEQGARAMSKAVFGYPVELGLADEDEVPDVPEAVESAPVTIMHRTDEMRLRAGTPGPNY